MAFSKITVNGVTNMDVTETTATSDKILTGYGCVGADGVWIDGSYTAPTPKTASDVTVSGATVTIPAGAYSSQVQKSVASGTAGTPTATKGTVSNHSISVTPSVTNTTGYISGGTKTGTTVSVSASELVSGTYTVSSTGTTDVSNYANISVAAQTLPSSVTTSSSGTSKATIGRQTSTRYLNIPTGYNATAQYYTISAVADGTAGTPTATKGTVSNHSVSVTPSVTNTTGYITGGTKTGTAVSVSASELVSGNLSITENGTGIDVANYSTVSVAVSGGGGSSMNVQVAQSTTRIASTTYTKTASLTCAVSGTYDVYWDCFRSTTSGTSGSQLHIGSNTYGSANTVFSNHAQNNHLTGVTINANQEVSVYVRSRASNYYAYCGQLTIVQTA